MMGDPFDGIIYKHLMMEGIGYLFVHIYQFV